MLLCGIKTIVFLFVCFLFWYLYNQKKIRLSKTLKKRSFNEWKYLWRNYPKFKVFHLCKIISRYLNLPNSFIYPKDLFSDIFIHSAKNLETVEVIVEIENYLKRELSDKELTNNRIFEDFIKKILDRE